MLSGSTRYDTILPDLNRSFATSITHPPSEPEASYDFGNPRVTPLGSNLHPTKAQIRHPSPFHVSETSPNNRALLIPQHPFIAR